MDMLQRYRGAIALMVCALLFGSAAGYYLSRGSKPHSDKPDHPIEWTKVQSVPTHALDSEDVAWEDRAISLDKVDTPRTKRSENTEVEEENSEQ
jgi:hypothetical protein